MILGPQRDAKATESINRTRGMNEIDLQPSERTQDAMDSIHPPQYRAYKQMLPHPVFLLGFQGITFEFSGFCSKHFTSRAMQPPTTSSVFIVFKF